MNNKSVITKSPTKMDVDLLIQKFYITKPGEVIKYDDISDAICVRKESTRWKSVMMAWRKELEEKYNVILRPIHGIGFMVCSESERVNVASEKYIKGVKSIIRSSEIASKTDRSELNDAEIKKVDFLQIQGSKLQNAMLEVLQKKSINNSSALGGINSTRK